MKIEPRFQEVNLVDQAEAIELILQAGVRHALSIHKRLGNPIAIWRDGKVVIVPPEEILISPEFSDPEDVQ
jgi:ABC-type proline/glycine betaine transport system ATPase subunit